MSKVHGRPRSKAIVAAQLLTRWFEHTHGESAASAFTDIRSEDIQAKKGLESARECDYGGQECD